MTRPPLPLIGTLRLVPSALALGLLFSGALGWIVAALTIGLQVLILAQVLSSIARQQFTSINVWALALGLYFPIAFLSELALALIGLPNASWLLIPSVGLVIGIHSLLTGNLGTPARESQQVAWLSVVIALALVIARNRFQFTKYGFFESFSPRDTHIDTIGFQLIANAGQSEGPGASGFMSDWSSRYHWLSYFWAGATETRFDLPAFSGILVFLPWLSVVGITVGVASLTVMLTRSRLVLVIAPTLSVAGQLLGTGLAANVNWDSMSQTVSGSMLVTGLLLSLHLYRSHRHRVFVLLALGVLTFALSGTKISAAVVLLMAAIGATWGPRQVLPTSRLIRVVNVTPVALGLLLGHLFFTAGNQSDGLLRLRNFAPPSLGQGQSGLSLADSATLVFLSASLFVLLPLILTRRGITAHSERGVNAALIALIGSLLPILVFEPYFPNSLWFLTSSLLLAVPASLVQTVAALPPGLVARVLRPTSIAAGLALLWEVLRRFETGELRSQLLLLSALWLPTVVLLLLQRGRQQLTFTVATASAASLFLLIVSVPVQVIFAALPQARSEAPPADGEEIESHQGTFVDESFDLETVTRQISPVTPSPGMIVVIPESLGTQALVWVTGQRIRPFLALTPYAVSTGPRGSDREVNRRSALAESWLSTPTEELGEELCDEGVSGVLLPMTGSTAFTDAYFIGALPCRATVNSGT